MGRCHAHPLFANETTVETQETLNDPLQIMEILGNEAGIWIRVSLTLKSVLLSIASFISSKIDFILTVHNEAGR